MRRGSLVAFLVAVSCLHAQHGATVDDAWKLAADGQQDQAVQLLQSIIAADGRNADARLLLGSLLMERGARTASLEQLREAVRLRPQSADAQNALGESYLHFGEMKAAREPLERAVALKPAFAVAQSNLGQVLVAQGDLPGAAIHLDRAIALFGRDPDAADAQYLRAKVWTAQAQPEKAAVDLEKAVALRPDFAEAWSDLGEARKTLLNDAGALTAYQRAVQMNANDAVAQYRLGAEYLHMNDPAAAQAPLEKAYALQPEDQSTLNALQMSLRRQGKTEEANALKARLADLLRKRDQENQNALKAVRLNNDGAALEKTGDLAGAVEKYSEALALYPAHNGIRVNYAVTLLRLGRWTEGLNQLHDALLRDPDNQSIQAAMRDALRQAPATAVPHWDPQ